MPLKKTKRRPLPGSISRMLPGALTLAACLVVWKAISLFFYPVFFPGPEVLLERMIAIYSDPASYVVIGQTLARIFEGFVISMLIGTALGLAMGLKRSIEIFFDSWIMVLLTFPAICWALSMSKGQYASFLALTQSGPRL